MDFLETHSISLLLLDINLGDRSGFELCRKIREGYDMPILFISARTSDDDVIIALITAVFIFVITFTLIPQCTSLLLTENRKN